MNLRLILKVLALLAFSFATTAGYLYYASLRKYALQEAEREALMQVEAMRKNLAVFLSENTRPVVTLAGLEEVRLSLLWQDDDIAEKTNQILDHFNKTLAGDVCYLMDAQGVTCYSSNRNAPDSFVGQNFAFRPYFQTAMQGRTTTYLALGTTSQKRGLYTSYPIYGNPDDGPIGVAVIKSSIDRIEKKLDLPPSEILLVTDPLGIIFISNRKVLLFDSAWKLSSEQVKHIAQERQFGNGPWRWAGFTRKDDRHVVDRSGNRYLMYQVRLDGFPGWTVYHLRDVKSVARFVSDPLIRITGPIVAAYCIMVGAAVFMLYRKANTVLVERKLAEDALRTSERRYRSLYHNTPAMLHSIDPKTGRLISVSEYWAKALGYSLDEVVGRHLIDFLTPESRAYAEKKVLPEFLKQGYCHDVPYQFIKRNGEIVDVLLSAISECDESGRIIRSLAVSIDVTQQKRAEAALRKAKEELSCYSQDLERQVRQRTREMISMEKKAHDQLRRLSGSIMENQEKERANIARELHDELGQVLTALRIDAAWIQKRMTAKDSRSAERAGAMCELIDDTIESVRSMAIRLRPGVLDHLGLVDALEWYTTDFERRTGIACIFENRGVTSVSVNVATAAYRITQEALTNVARHSHAGRVAVRLRMANGNLILTVDDNGCGVDTQRLDESTGLGVAGMRERAMLVGGGLAVKSIKTGGTRVQFKVPNDGDRRMDA
jgi:PAS domain S-box-containing protein